MAVPPRWQPRDTGAAPPPVRKTAPFRDDFDRADANPLSGPWLVSLNGGVRIRGGRIESAAPSDNGDVIVDPNHRVFRADQYAQVVLEDLGGDAPGGVVLRDDGGGHSYGFYVSHLYDRGLEIYQLKGAPGLWTLLYRHCPPVRAERFQAGDELRAEARTVACGVRLRAYVNGNLEAEFVDAGRHRLLGQPGMTIDRPPTTARLGSFEAGDLPEAGSGEFATFGRVTEDRFEEALDGNGAAVVSRFWCPVGAEVARLRAFTGNSRAGPSRVRGLLYSDVEGWPDRRVAVGEPVEIRPDGQRRWHDLPFRAPVRLAAGAYHLGFATERFAYTSCSGNGFGCGMRITYSPQAGYLNFVDPPERWPHGGRHLGTYELDVHAVVARPL